VKAAIETHSGLVGETQTHGCLPCQSGTPMNPQTCWRLKGTGESLPDRCRQPTPDPMPPPPRTLPVPTGFDEGAQRSLTDAVPPGYVHIPTALPNTHFVNLDASVKDSKRDKDFIPDLLTDE